MRPRIKRLGDLALGSVMSVAALPVVGVCAAAVRFGCGSPVFFTQERVGVDGATFRLYKFRTMTTTTTDGALGITSARDQRITPIGRVLRVSKLDELPQLFNVLRGDMSLVGPRPELAKYVSHWPPDKARRVLSFRPGLTGLASVVYRDESATLAGAEDVESFYVGVVAPHKLELEDWYVTHWSVLLDARILLATLLATSGERLGKQVHAAPL